jgi:hypothetical protein
MIDATTGDELTTAGRMTALEAGVERRPARHLFEANESAGSSPEYSTAADVRRQGNPGLSRARS